MRNNKKGNLMDHVPNIIIAVICLVLLLGLVVLVYRVLVNDEYKSAQKMMDVIETKIGAIGEGETTKFPIQSPCKKDTKGCSWYIRAWNSTDLDRPDRCYFNSCMCICNGDGGNEARVECQSSSTGICRFFDEKELKAISQKVVTVDAGIVFGSEDKLRVTAEILLSKPLIELKLEKNKGSLKLIYEDPEKGYERVPGTEMTGPKI